MTNSPHGLDEGYLYWLNSLVEPVRNPNPARTHSLLIEQLFLKEFRWSVPNDDNRAEDGKELRQEFLYEYDVDQKWMSEPCSVMEMLVALARRVAFEANGEPDEWFWILLNNLGLDRYTDDVYGDMVETEVNDVLDIFIERRYGHNGEGGGLFPLEDTRADQREFEIWYQMSSYLLEHGI